MNVNETCSFPFRDVRTKRACAISLWPPSLVVESETGSGAQRKKEKKKKNKKKVVARQKPLAGSRVAARQIASYIRGVGTRA